MKISQIIALSAAMVSTSALAFQARVNNNAIPAGQKSQTVEESIRSNDSYYGFHRQLSAAGVCIPGPVSGCHCAFCTLLRAGSAAVRTF